VNRLGPGSIAIRLAAGFAVVLILPGCLGAWYLAKVSTMHETARIESVLRERVEGRAARMLERLRQPAGDVVRLAADPALRRGAGAGDRGLCLSVLGAFIDHTGGIFRSAMVCDASGNVLAVSGPAWRRPGESVHDESWFVDAVQLSGIPSRQAPVSIASMPGALRYGTMIHLDDGRTAGAVVVEFPHTAFADQLRPTHGGTVALYDQDGHGVRPEDVLLPPPGTLDVARGLRSEGDSVAAWERIRPPGQRSVQWSVVETLDRAEVLAGLWYIQVVAAVAAVATAMAALALTVVMVLQVTRPLRRLAAAVSRMGRDSWDLPVVTGNDEVALLSRSLSGMAQRLTAQHSELEATVVALRRSGAELADSEARYRVIADFSIDWDYWLGPAGELRYISPSVERITGHPPADFFADPGLTARLIHPEDRHLLHTLAADGRQVLLRVVRRDGAVRWIEHLCLPVSAPDGSALGLRISNRDITGRKLLEERLVQAERMEAVGRLAGGVAHDFNNILAVITGHAELAAAATTDRSLQGRIERIRSAAERAAEITGQLLSLSRRRMNRPERLSPPVLIGEVVELIERLIGDSIIITVSSDDQVPEVLADRGGLVQVVMNLALNARDAMPQGGTIRIHAGSRLVDSSDARLHEVTPGRYATISVEDTGTGLDPEAAAHLFEPLFTTKGGRGHGLGLATVRANVNAAGGFITVHSAAGAGTSFLVHLPIAQGTGPVRTISRSPPPAQAGGRIVLLAEDQDDLRALLAEVLTEAGWTVIAAADGRQALQAGLSAAALDAAVLDVVMPGAGGPEVARGLRERFPSLPVLLISGYPGDHGPAAGALSRAEHLTKPFPPDALLNALATLTGRG
jgi:PAS domain S-box-containing protein